jgi:TetR/AcrR family transcriptional repressor of nem operon
MARPREFDEDEALERAMRMFWRQGFEATSVEDLVGETGLNRGSLYAAFGDKQALYLKALARYRTQRREQVSECLLQAPSVQEAFRRLFLSFVEIPEAQRGCGCLLVNAAMERAPHDPETARLVSDNLRGLEESFLRALERGQDAGELPRGRELRPLARYLVAALQGLIVLAKARSDRRTLRDAAEVSLSVLGAAG